MFNTEALLLQAALDGFGIAHLFEDGVRGYLEAGRSSGCWRIGVSRSLTITSTTRATASRNRRWPCWSRR